jgi:dTDP-4-amino-4,6-dideoxygalactose transaminase
VLRTADPAAELKAALLRRLGGARATLHASGREALRVAFAHLARTSGRSEIWIPGYTCFSIPAAAVAAGLRVRVVEIDFSARIDLAALAQMPLERAAALVVSNLFGVPEPVARLRDLLAPARVALVDDAAQSLGARSAEGPVGGRGDVGMLSFGRGKPLSGLGGGALVWAGPGGAPEAPVAFTEPPAPSSPARLAALARAAAFDLALAPRVFACLASIPALGIGETHYDPEFAQGPIDGASLSLTSAVIPDFETTNRARAARAQALAERIRAETRFAPLVASGGDEAVYPRLAVLAPSAAAREAALRALAALGASPMYPGALESIAALRPHLAAEPETPVARELAARLLTLPTARALTAEQLDRVLSELRKSA